MILQNDNNTENQRVAATYNKRQLPERKEDITTTRCRRRSDNNARIHIEKMTRTIKRQ
ncbi:hypothetical protein L484_015138 [Morus notabilis]|uniref:Uncharacterized protein n=1 Tax=Morus notabilis TaxID=981085 RepID=W9SEZ9_9ROSA|nr:hypothetical protein L484_015138 [Morus notabilis]